MGKRERSDTPRHVLLGRPCHHGRRVREGVLHGALRLGDRGHHASGNIYTMCRPGGDAVCGIFELSGMPSSRTSYVTVEDAGAAAGRARELGGTVIDDAST